MSGFIIVLIIFILVLIITNWKKCVSIFTFDNALRLVIMGIVFIVIWLLNEVF